MYEYKVVEVLMGHIPAIVEIDANTWGKEGWRVVHFQRIPYDESSSHNHNGWLLLERQITSQEG